MLVTEFGMVNEVRFRQLRNALLPMLVTKLGMVTTLSLPKYAVSRVFSASA